MAGIRARSYDVVPGSPGEALLRLFMVPLGLSAYRLATDLGVPPIAVSQLLRGRRAISAAMATRLGVYFGVEPEFWMALQSAYDLQVSARNGEAGANGGDMVTRCAALVDRQFIIRETKAGNNRQYEVILAKMRLVAPARDAAAPPNGLMPDAKQKKGRPQPSLRDRLPRQPN